MNITHDHKNALLHRREVTFVFPSASNPGYAAVQKALAEKTGTSDDVIVIKHVSNAYGSSEFVIKALVYDSVAFRQKFEPKPKAAKGGAS